MRTMYFRFLTFVFVFLFSVVAFTPLSNAIEYPVSMKVGCIASPKSPWGKAAYKFADIVMKETDGKVIIKVFPSSQLGKNIEMVKQLSQGSLEFLVTGEGFFTIIDKRVNIYGMPYLFTDSSQVIQARKSVAGKKLTHEVEKKAGVTFLAQDGWMPMRNVISKIPITKLEDMKGLKIRVPSTKVMLMTFKSLGANPVEIGYSEVYVSLSQGLVQAMDGPLASLYRSRAHEVCKYITLTEHSAGSLCVVTNTKIFNELKPEYQNIIKHAAEKALEMSSELFKAEEKTIKKELEDAGVQFYSPDLEPFREATRTLPEQLLGKEFVDYFKANMSK